MNVVKDINYGFITDHIIEIVKEESVLSGFQYGVDFTDIEDEFGLTLDTELVDELTETLLLREEVADVYVEDDVFVVVLYTFYAPNYDPNEYNVDC